MNVAYLLAIVTATTSASAAAIHVALARAPGWRRARAFAAIALSATVYSIGNGVFSSPDASDALHRVAIRANYFSAHVHALLWLPWLLGGAEGRWRGVPRGLRRFAAASLAVALLFAATGWQLADGEIAVHVAWAGVTYHYARTTAIGSLYGYLLAAQLLLPALLLAARARSDRTLRPVALGFVIYLACGAVEALVANGVVETLSPADVGFLAVIVPTSLIEARRFVADARRLNELSGRLAGEVRERTEERDRAETALRESERLAALGRLAAGVGHEINNPLAYLQGALEPVDAYLASAGAPGPIREAMSDARDGAWRIQKVVEGLRTYSQRHAERIALDLRDVARAALKVAQPSLRHAAALETELEPAPSALGDEPRLVQALVNLLTNAVQAVSEAGPPHGRVRLATGATAAGEPYLEVEDDGPGIPAAVRERLGEPYLTTRGERGGLGLGLFTTRGIVDAHGGRLELAPLLPRGTRARIVLPASAGPAPEPKLAQPALSASPAEGCGDRPRLLVVDDEPRVLRVLAQLLGDEWEVAVADGAGAARAQLAAGGFAAVLCDLQLGGGSGAQLAEEVATRDPALRARMLFMTGGAITAEAQAFLARSDVRSVAKPLDFTAVRRLLREISA